MSQRQEHCDNSHIGQVVHQLIHAQGNPERVVGRGPSGLFPDPFLQPICMIMDHEFRGSQDQRDLESCANDQQTGHRRHRMDCGVLDAFRMTVNALELDVLRRLEDEIAEEMLDLKQPQRKQRDEDRLSHKSVRNPTLEQSGRGGAGVLSSF